ncbi:MAG: CYTH domain-containing protein [Bacteroidales bacterium]
MKKEIERKFLVVGEYKDISIRHTHIIQGYISSDPERCVRIRIRDEQSFITIKGIGSDNGMSRFEWEKEIPLDEGLALLTLCEPGSVIDKVRHEVPIDKEYIAEVDEFKGDNEGLVMVEVELQSTEDKFEIPSWFGEEVTGDIRYYNSMLAKRPYKLWKCK